ncbi:MAG: hypothetical protein JW712_08485 [Dehalococcoidales bacterium]|nr:hypothetical protein [Dehalococcoidales bacterium]
MKINILQIIFGMAIVIMMTLSIAWDTTGFIARYMIEPGNWETVFNPDTKEVIATVLAYLVMLFTCALIGVSISLIVKRIKVNHAEDSAEITNGIRKLIITQTVLGVLIAVSSFLVGAWGFPTSYNFVGSGEFSHVMSFMPGRQFVAAEGLAFCVFLTGIVSSVCGIVQYILWRRKTNATIV